MDLTIRDWMVIVGVLLILAVLLDAWRRVRNERRSPVQVKLAGRDPSTTAVDDDIGMLKELPNGGARVVERSDLVDAAVQNKADKAQQAARAERVARASSPDQTPPSTAAPATREPSPPKREPASPRVKARPAPSASKPAAPPAEDDDLVSGLNTRDEPENLDWLDALEAEERSRPAPEAAGPGRLPRDVEPEVFMLNVVARKPEGFRGDDILHILLACDLRFGDMSFFHRHEFEAGRGAIQFSVANMMQPGVFDIDNMSDFTTPGLVFFVTLPGPDDMMKAFDYMLETAQAVARNLDGDVLDETRSALTRQTMEHSRQQIRDLERRLLARSR
ncbi:cell division protein ZipA [Haliea sp. E1-2-M8]|uniref:cell division protein ZipA n=1 Tax=Haliea sp. E1-2-M8 TaxID=3064706 RepID=UPI002726BF3B|nr:cell division protein ZipA [Haliea sp. E1-2-M8]MDO8860889.1 cell division protein ZipA [Haliea sp. E1-2-M8]